MIRIKRGIVKRTQGTDRTSRRQRDASTLFAQSSDLSAALPGVNNNPLSYQLRSHQCPTDKALQSAAVPLSQFFPSFTLLAFCLPHLLTLQPFQGKNHCPQHSQNGLDLKGAPLALLKYKQQFNTNYSMNSNIGLQQ